MSSISITKTLLIFNLYFSLNLSAKEKQIGYYDSLAVMNNFSIWSDANKTIHIFDSVSKVTLSDMEKYYVAEVEKYAASKESMSEKDRTRYEDNLREQKEILEYKKDMFVQNSEIVRARLYEPIISSLREAISILTQRHNLSVFVTTDRLNDSDKLESLNLTQELIAEVIRLEKIRKSTK